MTILFFSCSRIILYVHKLYRICHVKKKKSQKCRATIGNLQVYVSFLLPSQMFG